MAKSLHKFNMTLVSRTFEEQANELGFTLNREAQKFENLKLATNDLLFNKLITDIQADKIFKKLNRKVNLTMVKIGEFNEIQ